MTLGLAQWTFTVENLVIVLGYIFMAFAVVPYMQIRSWTKVWGALFFFFCALTHVEMAAHAYAEEPMGFVDRNISGHLQFVHLMQALSVWGFVHGLYREFVTPRVARSVKDSADA